LSGAIDAETTEDLEETAEAPEPKATKAPELSAAIEAETTEALEETAEAPEPEATKAPELSAATEAETTEALDKTAKAPALEATVVPKLRPKAWGPQKAGKRRRQKPKRPVAIEAEPTEALKTTAEAPASEAIEVPELSAAMEAETTEALKETAEAPQSEASEAPEAGCVSYKKYNSHQVFVCGCGPAHFPEGQSFQLNGATLQVTSSLRSECSGFCKGKSDCATVNHQSKNNTAYSDGDAIILK
jgi:hypothetical protein